MVSAVLNLEIVKPPPKWRTLLILGRVSNLPTVWSNCVAGWWLGGGHRWGGLALALLSMSFLYIGGMFLNDAFDANFDRRHRKLRPIPSGAISEDEVWRWGSSWMILGVAIVVWLNWTTAALTLVLLVCIVVYDATHKAIGFAPALMGACRFFVYLIAAAAGGARLSGQVIWPALALAAYVAGLSSLARKESGATHPSMWPAIFLAAPLVCSALINDDVATFKTAILALLLAVWILWSLAQTFWSAFPRIGSTVARLLAGVALVDLLAAAPGQGAWLWLFPALFAAALFLQSFIPAT